MADVYRATDRVLDRPVAIKMLRDSTGDDTDRVRFTREATTLAQLSHRGLVMLLDAGIEEERPFIVLELVEGPTLARTLAESGPLDLDTVGRIGAQLGEALAYAHGRGVVHRDVKPGNVLLGPEGRVKLADFGIARLIGDHVRHTRTGEAIGTAAYLAPEQVTGGPVDGAADVYSLGLLLLEALTGDQAYPGTPTEAALARLSRPPVVPSWLPAGWRSLLEAMTRLDPTERPAAGDVASRLRAPSTTPAETAHERTPRARLALARSPALAAAIVLVVLMVAGAVFGRTHHLQPAAAQDSQSSTPGAHAPAHRGSARSSAAHSTSPHRTARQSRPASHRVTVARTQPAPARSTRPHHSRAPRPHRARHPRHERHGRHGGPGEHAHKPHGPKPPEHHGPPHAPAR